MAFSDAAPTRDTGRTDSNGAFALGIACIVAPALGLLWLAFGWPRATVVLALLLSFCALMIVGSIIALQDQFHVGLMVYALVLGCVALAAVTIQLNRIGGGPAATPVAGYSADAGDPEPPSPDNGSSRSDVLTTGQAIETYGHVICDALRAGERVEDLASRLAATGEVDQLEAAALIGTVVSRLCPSVYP